MKFQVIVIVIDYICMLSTPCLILRDQNSINNAFMSLEIVLILANSADPDEMPPHTK